MYFCIAEKLGGKIFTNAYAIFNTGQKISVTKILAPMRVDGEIGKVFSW